MIYELAEAIGQFVCACLVVQPGDPDEQTMRDGFDCYCPERDVESIDDCCVVIGWEDHVPDACCAVVVSFNQTDYNEKLPQAATLKTCWGIRTIQFEVEYRVCSPHGDTNETSVFADFAKYLMAIVERLNACFACTKVITVDGTDLPIYNITAMVPTNDGVAFGLEVQLA